MAKFIESHIPPVRSTCHKVREPKPTQTLQVEEARQVFNTLLVKIRRQDSEKRQLLRISAQIKHGVQLDGSTVHDRDALSQLPGEPRV